MHFNKLIGSFFFAVQLFSIHVASQSIETVEVDPNLYQGFWYQTYGDKFVTSTFEKDAYCATADYTILNDETIGVFNWERIGSPTGEVQNISGYAFITDQPGQLIVYFLRTYLHLIGSSNWVQ